MGVASAIGPGLSISTPTVYTTQNKKEKAASAIQAGPHFILYLGVLSLYPIYIGQFLVVILDPKNEDRLMQNSQSALAAFLQGWTVVGTQPINATRLMFHHCLSQDGPRDANTAYHPLPIYAQPPTIPSFHPQSISSSLDSMSDVTSTPGLGFDTRSIWNGVRAHCSLKQYSFHEVLEDINSKIKTLVKESTLCAEGSVALSWSKTMAFSFMQTQELIQKKAPALWLVLTMAAIGNGNIGRLLGIWKEAKEGARGCGSNNMRDPWLVSEASLMHLVY